MREKRISLRCIFFLLVMMLATRKLVIAQDGPPPILDPPPPSDCYPDDPDPDPNDPCIPIDGGLAFLLAAGIGYGVVKNKSSMKNQ